jgi:hypothetical protein
MRTLQLTRPEETLEEYQIAVQLYARDQHRVSRTERRQAMRDAAVELGLPAEYLRRAAVILRARRMARARWWRRAGESFRSSVAVGMVLLFGWYLHHPLVDDGVSSAAPPRAAAPARSEAARQPASPPIGTPFPVDLHRWANQALTRPMLNICGNDLSGLGAGMHELAGVPFRADGAILVGPGETGAPGLPVRVPRRVVGIRIGRKADRLFFLHGAHFVFPTMYGVKIGAYVIRYADGKRQQVPIRAGVDVGDWWESGAGATEAQVAWTGSCAAAAGAGTRVRLYMVRWENPRPAVKISQLEVETGDQPAGFKVPAPFLVGVTAARDLPERSAGLQGSRGTSGVDQVSGNLLVNGSFEEAGAVSDLGILPFGLIALPGWRLVRGTVDVVPASYWQSAPGQGDHSLDLAGTPGAATLEQTFPTRRGREYCFSGWLAHNPTHGATPEGRADVFINGRLLTQLRHHNAGATSGRMGWQRFTCRFRARSARTTLRLTDVTGSDIYGLALDGLAVTPRGS